MESTEVDGTSKRVAMDNAETGPLACRESHSCTRSTQADLVAERDGRSWLWYAPRESDRYTRPINHHA